MGELPNELRDTQEKGTSPHPMEYPQAMQVKIWKWDEMLKPYETQFGGSGGTNS